jgi:hypothetical protein
MISDEVTVDVSKFRVSCITQRRRDAEAQRRREKRKK